MGNTFIKLLGITSASTLLAVIILTAEDSDDTQKIFPFLVIAMITWIAAFMSLHTKTTDLIEIAKNIHLHSISIKPFSHSHSSEMAQV